jgi:hypothetical protein
LFLGGWVPTLALAALVAMTVGCEGGSDALGIGSQELLLIEAGAMVDGQSIDGETIGPGHDERTVRFEARLVDDEGRPARGHAVRVAYDIPGMGMMRRTGTFMLHDDGMYGDLIPRDGHYCYEDESHQYDCHGADTRPGDYHYEFCGIHDNGYESNRIEVTIFVVR